MKKNLLLFLLIAINFSVSAQTIRRVSTDGTTTNNGSSWSSTMDLQKALSASIPGDEVWVKVGVYTPTETRYRADYPNYLTDNSTKSFHIREGVKVYGGFDGVETSISARNSSDSTVLSGYSSASLSHYNVVFVNTNKYTEDDKIILDNITITKGKSLNYNGTSSATNGSAIWIKGHVELNNVSINNCTSYSGAVFLASSSVFKTTNCTFSNNTSHSYTNMKGSCIYTEASTTITINNSVFKDNKKSNTASQGGAIFANGGMSANPVNLTINNSLFLRNETTTSGGALQLQNKVNATITNTVFKENKAKPNITASYNYMDYTDSAPAYHIISNGGGAICYTASNDGGINHTGWIKIQNCEFESNQSTARAGALYITSPNNSESYIRNSSFKNNAAGISGAALEYKHSNKNASFNVYNQDFIISNNVFYNNSAKFYGGAVSATAACPIIFANNTFFKNSITNDTQAITASETEVGSGAAIHLFGPSSINPDLGLRRVFVNCIFAENTAPSINLKNIAIKLASPQSDKPGSYTKNTLFLDGTGFTTDTDASVKTPDNSSFTLANIFKSTNPLSSHFLRLDYTNSLNPAINTGLNSITRILPASTNLVFTVDSLDLANQSRILSTTIDMGAYEAHPLATEVLPVELLSVDIQKTKQNAALLTWKVASETSNNRFIIERSLDGISYSEIGIKLSNGDTNAITNYNFTDNNPLNGISYYRLSQIDTDGTTKVLAVKSFNYSTLSNEISIYPVPAKEYLNIRLANKNNEKIVVNLLTITGKKVLTQTFGNEQDAQINLSNVTNGNYIIMINNGAQLEKRLITISK